MTDAAKKILEQFDALPEEDQRWLADVIVDRVRGDDDELSDEWKQEIARRIDQLRSGEVKPVPGTDVDARIRASLARVRKSRGND